MPWFKVDDKLHSHKKAVRAGVAAMGLWTIAGSWCADQLTDGFVPDYIALRFDRDAESLAARLVDAGLWFVAEHEGDAGWRFHEWDEYQPTRDEVESRREYEREKKRRQRRNSRGQFEANSGDSEGDEPEDEPGDSPEGLEGDAREDERGDAEGDNLRVSPGDTDGTPSGVTPSRPDPTRPVPKDLNPLSTGVDPDDGFQHFWEAWPKRNGKKLAKNRAHAAWKKLTLPERRAAYIGAKHYADASNAGMAGAKDAFRWLQGREWPDWQTPARQDRPARQVGRPTELVL